MFEVEVFIPVADNEGNDFDDAHDRAWEAHLAETFNGLYQRPNLATGGWVDKGRYYPDTMRIFVVSLPSIIDGGKLEGTVEFAKQHYRQVAIYLRYLGLSEIL